MEEVNTKKQQEEGSSNAENDTVTDDEIINWEEEAVAIIRDVKAHVSSIEISRRLPNSESKIYLNVQTIEGDEYCVHVSNMGFRIVGNAFDTIDPDKSEAVEEEVYETPYALLDKISPSYVESFGNQLCKQLLNLQQMRTQFNEEDEEELEEDRKEGASNAAI